MQGTILVPPSKSLTNRALNLALLAEGGTEIVRPLDSEDTQAMALALEQVGCAVERGPAGLTVGRRREVARAEIDCGASGTMLRFLTASLTTVPGEWFLDGTDRLRERPLGPLIAALRKLGAEIECFGPEGFAPVRIRGGTLAGGRAALDAGASSQFLSAVLMAATRARGPVSIGVRDLTSEPYVDLTLQAMADFGIRVDRQGDLFAVEPQVVHGRRFEVEGDYSSACYFGAAAALTGGRIKLDGLRQDSRQGDRRFFSILEQIGAVCEWREDRLEVHREGTLVAVSDDLSDIPDQVPTLAVLAPFCAGTTGITGVGHLRLKESDRLNVVAGELARAGVSGIDQAGDGLSVPGVWGAGGAPADPVTIDTADDHRIAMAFSVLGLCRPGVSIANPEVVAKSYPGFWKDFESPYVDP